jgi:hypothetical protein
MLALGRVSRFAVVGAVMMAFSQALHAQAGASYQLVAFTGQAAPGGGTFAHFGLPKLGADGTVAFLDGVDESGTPRVVASYFGTLRLVGKAGAGTPEGDGTFADFSAVSVAFDGRVAFNGSADLPNEATRFGIWGEGVGAQVPDTLYDFGPVAFRAGSILGLKSQVADPSSLQSLTKVDALSILGAKGADNVLLAGQTLPSPAGVVAVKTILDGSVYPDPFVEGYRAGTEVDVNESGHVALKVLTTPTASPTPSTRQAIYSGPRADLKSVAVSGDAAPGLADAVLADLSPRPSMASNDSVAFSATTMEGESSSSAVFAGRPGALHPVVKAGDSVPGAPGVVFDDVFSSVVINETGDVIFKARIRYPNFGTRDGIWIQRVSGRPVLIAADGIQLPTPSGNQEVTAVDFAGPGTFNDLHQFVFRATFDSGDGIYLADTRATIPWVRATYPRKARDRVTRASVYTISGMAEDDTGVAKVEYTIQREKNGRKRLKATGKARHIKHFKARSIPKLAKGDKRWSFRVSLSIGDNRIEVVATDRLGNVSEPLVLVIRRY